MVPYDHANFALSVSQDPPPVVLYSPWPKPDEPAYDGVKCANSAAFEIHSQTTDESVITVSVCPDHVARLRAAAASSARGFDAMLAIFQTSITPIPADKLRAMGWYRERATLAGGAERHYVPIIVVGHGVAALSTVILLTDKKAVVVQADVMQLCGDGANPLPLCADPKGTLSAIAQRLLR